MIVRRSPAAPVSVFSTPFLTALLAAAALACAGCGIKGPLRLPPKATPGAVPPAAPTTSPPATTAPPPSDSGSAPEPRQ